MKFVFLKIIIVLLVISPILHADEEQLCTKSAIESACEPMVNSAATAMNCYKGSKGYAGVQCPKECKDKVVYCIENEKINLKTTFEN